MQLEFHSVDTSRWPDLETLFEGRGGPHYCWCTAWRKVQKAAAKATKAERKSTISDLINGGIPVGILAYDQGQPIAWCSIAPPETYRTLTTLVRFGNH